MTARRRSLLLLFPLLSVGVMAWIVVQAWQEAEGNVLALPLGAHLGAIAAFGIGLLVRGARLVVLARSTGGSLSLEAAVRSQLAGEAAGAVTPSRSGCEPAKAFIMERSGLDLPRAGAVMVGEMLGEIAMLVPVVACFVLFLPGTGPVAAGGLAYAGVVGLTTTAALVLAGLPGDRPPPRAWRAVGLSRRTWRKLQVGATRFRRRAARLRRMRAGNVLLVLALSLVHIAARLAVLPALTQGAPDPSTMAALLAWPVLLLYGGALLPAPGGGGLVEAGYAAGLGPLLATGTLAGTLVWWRLYTSHLGALLGAAVFVAAGRRSLPGLD